MEENNRQNQGLTGAELEDFSRYCRSIPDFPKKGIIFKDITTLLKDGDVFRRAIDRIAGHFASQKIDVIACIDARGFLIGAALAYKIGCGVVPIRKKGKLPWKVHQKTYDLEYGQDCLEIHQDAIDPGQRVLIVDDVLATGGTAAAAVEMAREMKGEIVGAAFLMELAALKGRSRISGVNVFSLIED